MSIYDEEQAEPEAGEEAPAEETGSKVDLSGLGEESSSSEGEPEAVDGASSSEGESEAGEEESGGPGGLAVLVVAFLVLAFLSGSTSGTDRLDGV